MIMSHDYTQLQSGDDQQQARDLSLRHTRPPTQVPGYDLTRFLGSGAYGEVWTGLDRNTGRQIAVKFYRHRGGVDWSLLSREVEKLVLLSADRYVVQLLDVGWQSDPPYYVMEFIENGSLEKSSGSQQPRSIEQIVELFREIATGLNHAHAKGILHCDLKPANVLLDQDHRPRLADFGQSRLTDEQAPSLGTLFYMAPEQADLKAIPDARWDVYALGAILHFLLVGKPPHHDEQLLAQIDKAPDLTARLRCYRQWIGRSKLPDEHRKLPGVDRTLAGIVDRCLQSRPSKRFPNVQSVLDALRTREQARARRPLLVLGVLGPLLLLALMGVFGYISYADALHSTEAAVTQRARVTNSYAASFAASSVAAEIERYFRALDEVAEDRPLRAGLSRVTGELGNQLDALAEPQLPSAVLADRKRVFLHDPFRQDLQSRVDELQGELSSRMARYRRGATSQGSTKRGISLFVCGPRGTHLAGAFPEASTATIGDNFAYRSYCHGGPRDLHKGARPLPDQHVQTTSISSPLLSRVNQRWKIAVSTPICDNDEPGELLAVAVLTVEVGAIVRDHLKFADVDERGYCPHFGILVDGRNNGFQGMVLDHPLFSNEAFRQRYFQEDNGGSRDREFSSLRVDLDARSEPGHFYRDPFGGIPEGRAYKGDWIVASAPVTIEPGEKPADSPTGSLLVFVQEDRAYATRDVQDLAGDLSRHGTVALIGFVFVVGLLWFFVLRAPGGGRWWWQPSFAPGSSMASPVVTPMHPGSTAAAKTAHDSS